MRQRLAIILTFAAWLFATGSHWDLVQSFAWGKMFAAYSQTMSYADAARMTFTAENLCGVCELVQDAKQTTDENGQPAPAEAGAQKILLALHAPAPVALSASPSPFWSLSDFDHPAPLAVAPPVPPPRA